MTRGKSYDDASYRPPILLPVPFLIATLDAKASWLPAPRPACLRHTLASAPTQPIYSSKSHDLSSTRSTLLSASLTAAALSRRDRAPSTEESQTTQRVPLLAPFAGFPGVVSPLSLFRVLSWYVSLFRSLSGLACRRAPPISSVIPCVECAMRLFYRFQDSHQDTCHADTQRSNSHILLPAAVIAMCSKEVHGTDSKYITTTP
jgi:hypothetical protein